jgi:hypothetical protein
MNTHILNKVKIKPVQVDNNLVKCKGYDMFETMYASIGIFAKRNSGKTTVVSNVIDRSINKNTIVIIISSTISHDPTYKKIMEKLKKRNIRFQALDSIIDDDGNNFISDFIQSKNIEAESNEDPEVEEEKKIQMKEVLARARAKVLGFVYKPRNTKPKIKKPKKIKQPTAPEYLFVIDDMGSLCRNKAICQFLKVSRHYKAKVIICVHTATDLMPQAHIQLDYYLIFKGFSREQLLKINYLNNLGVSDDKLLEIFDTATHDKYSFLYIDVKQGCFRINFNKSIE